MEIRDESQRFKKHKVKDELPSLFDKFSFRFLQKKSVIYIKILAGIKLLMRHKKLMKMFFKNSKNSNQKFYFRLSKDNFWYTGTDVINIIKIIFLE